MSQPFQIKVDQFAWSREYLKLEKAFKHLQKESRKSTKEILQSQARLFCIDLIHVTQPWGRGTKAKKMGENAIRKDIKRAYLTESALYELIKEQSEGQAKAFYHFMKKNDIEKAQSILDSLSLNRKIEEFDGGKHHQSKRNRRGRISRSVMPKYISSKSGVEGYIKDIQKRVGLAKGGWADAALDLSAVANGSIMSVNKRGIPAWARRHADTKRIGSAKFSKRGPIDQVIIINKIRYIHKLVGKYEILKAMGSRARAMERLVKKVIEINAQKTMRTKLLNSMSAGL